MPNMKTSGRLRPTVVATDTPTAVNTGMIDTINNKLTGLSAFYGAHNQFFRNTALLLSIAGVIMLIKKFPNMIGGDKEIYSSIVAWGFFSTVLIGYYINGSPKVMYYGIGTLVSACILLIIFQLSIADIIDYANGEYFKGGEEAKKNYRKATTTLANQKLTTTANIATAKAKLKLVISTEKYKKVMAGTRMVIKDTEDFKPAIKNNDVFVKVAIIKNGVVDTALQDFPYRLLKTDLGYYKKPNLRDGNLTETNTEKECTDCELLYPGQYKVVALLNGEKPKKYLRLPSTGYPFKIGRSHDQTNFCIKTRTGLIIPFSKIRTSNFFLDHRDFMIIPTDKNIVKIGIKT